MPKTILSGLGIILVLFFFSSPGQAANIPPAETKVSASTVLIYMVGANLESQNMAASLDLMEMVMAQTGNNTQVIVELGGANRWWLPLNSDQSLAVEPWQQLLDSYKTDPINFLLPNSSGWSASNQDYTLVSPQATVQRYAVQHNKLIKLEDLGAINMSDPQTLSDFVQFGVKNYPAQRYELILWDHGGGTIGGFGLDETQEAAVALSLADISQALKEACQTQQIHFDFIGFDACLMGTLETAYALKDYADYLLVSEENVSSQSLYYTNWLSRLDTNPQISTVDLAQGIITDFLQNSGDYSGNSTLALYDLSKIEKVYAALNQLFAVSLEYLQNEPQAEAELITARLLSYGYGENQIEQIDLLDYTNHLENEIFQEPKAKLMKAVQETIATSGFGYAVYGTCCGMAMYYPYYYLGLYEQAGDMLKQIGLGGSYEEYYQAIANLMLFVQNKTLNTPSYFKTEPVQTGSDYSWYNPELELNYDFSLPDYRNLEIKLNDSEEYILPLDNPQAQQLVEASLQITQILQPGSYLDLGVNKQLELDETGNLKVAFKGKGLFLNGKLVPFYNLSTTSLLSMGYVPCRINQQEETYGLLVYWFDESEIIATGYLNLKDNTQYPLVKGDTVQAIAQCYDQQGKWQKDLLLGDPIIYLNANLFFKFKEVPEGRYLATYLLTDIYQAHYWTNTLELNY